jgi:Cu+-exporting ATPase
LRRDSETQVDPVCGMTVEMGEARAQGRVATYEGRTYAFCSEGCLREFLESPESYREAADPRAPE